MGEEGRKGNKNEGNLEGKNEITVSYVAYLSP